MAESSGSDLTDTENRSYRVTFASPHRRLLAFLFDSAIVYAMAVVVIFFPARDDIRAIIADTMKEKEISMEVDAAGKVSNLKGKITGQTKINSEAYSKIKQKLAERIGQNKVYSYFLFAIPVLYNLLCLLVARKTVGQSMFSLMVIAGYSENLSFMDIFSRVLIFTALRNIFLVPFSIVLPVLFTRRRMTAYDYISNTYVIEIR
ncbi:MAG: RDD family protein [Rickettsiales bacterium]|jgi:uncharacterized RDD family membrane protein YckC|nr:RDD family protein [Rickettsiales bacterium]